MFLFKYSLCSTAPRQLCSDCVLTLLVFGFYLFVFLLINASALCTWLRHPHVTASMPRSWSGCVTLVSEPIPGRKCANEDVGPQGGWIVRSHIAQGSDPYMYIPIPT